MADSARAPSLTTRTVTGASWVFIWRLSTRLMGMVSTVVLVRLLTPADFGLVALATSFSQSVDWLSSIGVREALVRDDRLDQALYDTGFTLSALRGAGMALVIAAGAWPVATFFEEPRLAQILFVLALATFLSAIENIGTVDFRRTMAFQKEFQLAVIPRMAAIAASIGTAVAFASYWALIVGIATNAVTRVLLSYRMHPYRPHLTLSAWRQIFGFSFWTWATATTQLVRDRIDTVVIGRLFGPTLVGVYSVGWEVGSLASTEVVEPVTAALFPGFAEARRSGGSVADGYFRAISATFLVTLPMGLGMSLIAAPVIRLAFGDRWMAAVPLVQVVAVVSVARVIAYISSVLLI